MNLFGKWVFVDVTGLKVLRCEGPGSRGQALNPLTSVLTRNRRCSPEPSRAWGPPSWKRQEGPPWNLWRESAR